jgi:hypothetical protein
MSGLLLGMVLSVWTCWFHSMFTFPPRLVSTDFGTCSYQWFCPIVPMFPCICWSVVVHSLYRVFLCTILFHYYYYYPRYLFYARYSHLYSWDKPCP